MDIISAQLEIRNISVGSHFRPRLLVAYLVVGAVTTAAQLIVVLTIFFAQTKVADAIEKTDGHGVIDTDDLCALAQQFSLE